MLKPVAQDEAVIPASRPPGDFPLPAPDSSALSGFFSVLLYPLSKAPQGRESAVSKALRQIGRSLTLAHPDARKAL
jgi:hypothetical protein